MFIFFYKIFNRPLLEKYFLNFKNFLTISCSIKYYIFAKLSQIVDCQFRGFTTIINWNYLIQLLDEG